VTAPGRLSRATVKRLERLAGTLTHASKMPGPCAPSLPTDRCQTGGRLRSVPGTPCHKCYARRLEGAYPTASRTWHANAQALDRALESPAWARVWVYAMAALLADDAKRLGETRVRWHVAGDVQSRRHLALIYRVARLTPHLRHRLPSQEWAILGRAWQDGLRPPRNVNVQLSLPRIGAPLPGRVYGAQVTGVLVGADRSDPRTCPATMPDVHECGACDRCWRPDAGPVVYRLH
jgi:hypothetical protein